MIFFKQINKVFYSRSTTFYTWGTSFIHNKVLMYWREKSSQANFEFYSYRKILLCNTESNVL